MLVRAQYSKLLSNAPVDKEKEDAVALKEKEDAAAEARIMLRQWCAAAANHIYDPQTGRRVEWAAERGRAVWERVYPLMVACCYRQLKDEEDLEQELKGDVQGLKFTRAGEREMPADLARDALRVEALMSSRVTQCPVPTSSLTPHMEKKYSREAPSLTRRALGKDSSFSLSLPTFKAQWEALFEALPEMHWETDSFITARLIWSLLPETHRKRLAALPWVRAMEKYDWSTMTQVEPPRTVFGWYTAVLRQQGVETLGGMSFRQLLNAGFAQASSETSANYFIRCLTLVQEARASLLETWDSEARDDFARIAYAGQTKADRQSPALEQLAPLSVWREETSDKIIQLLTEADKRRGDRAKWATPPVANPTRASGSAGVTKLTSRAVPMSVDRVQENHTIPDDHVDCMQEAIDGGEVRAVREGVCTWCLVKVRAGQAHPERCEEPVTCLRCLKPGHKVRQCPEPKPAEQEGPRKTKAAGPTKKKKPAQQLPVKGAGNGGQDGQVCRALWSLEDGKGEGGPSLNAHCTQELGSNAHLHQPEQILIDLHINTETARECADQPAGIEHISKILGKGKGGGIYSS